MRRFRILAAILMTVLAGCGRYTYNPFPKPIPASDGVILVNFAEFASIPYVDNEAPRMMRLTDEPGTHRLFINTMRGPLHSVSYDGHTVVEYLDVNAPRWGVKVQFSGSERGVQSLAFHPQFNQPSTPGYGKFYVYTDTANITPKVDFLPSGEGHTHDLVLLEWTAKNPQATRYDGGPPREIFRVAKPFQNHNGGLIAFNPLATPGTPDYGMLYVGSADGGAGGDPYHHAQNVGSIFGKILRIDPLGSNSRNGKYGIPADNPFVKNAPPGTAGGVLGEIYAYGCRNPQRFSWDPQNGKMLMADIGQNIVEKVTFVPPGANLGWNKWEGSFAFFGHLVRLANERGDPKVTYPFVEYDHSDPLFQRSVAVTGVIAYRDSAIPQLTNKVIFGDNPSGELFYVDADHPPNGGQDAIRRILFNDHGSGKTLLELIREKNAAMGTTRASRADLRMDLGPDGRIFVLDKADGVVRVLLP